MQNTTELRKELSKVFYLLKKGKLDTKTCKEIVATSNTMLKSAKLEMDHSRMTDNKEVIDFLKTPITE